MFFSSPSLCFLQWWFNRHDLHLALTQYIISLLTASNNDNDGNSHVLFIVLERTIVAMAQDTNRRQRYQGAVKQTEGYGITVFQRR